MSSSDLPELWTEPKKLGTLLVNNLPILDTENDFETQNFEIFDKVVHNFGKFDDDDTI